jgi:DNA-binding transcriptional LysR family regulator
MEGEMALTPKYDLRSLEIFVNVHESRSMTIAADRFGITQSAVSQAIRTLEGTLAVQLVDRTTRPLTVTAAGDWLARIAAQILHDVGQISNSVNQFRTNSALRLRIGVVDTLSDPFVPGLVKRLSPSISFLSISSSFVRSLRNSLINKNLDLLITNDSSNDNNSLRRLPVLTEPYLLAVPKTLTDDALVPGFLRTSPLIRWSSQSQICADIDAQLQRMRMDLTRQFEFDSARTIFGMVAAGLGWAIVPSICVFEIVRVLDNIRLLPFPGPRFTRTVSVIYRANENEALSEHIYLVAKEIIREQYISRILDVAPWLTFEADNLGDRLI